jgi:dipeptide transport system ATP-binding protein
MSEIILQLKNAKKYYKVSQNKTVKALDDVNIEVRRGQTLAIVGESGCGKSTLAKYLMRLEKPTAGEYLIENQNAFDLANNTFYSQIQMVFQDPYSSLNPRKKIGELIAEPLMVNSSLSKKECLQKAREVMELVGLAPEYMKRYPHMLSGGQRQRVGISRALILKPKILILDEPVSALDVSVQSQVLNLLKDLQKELGLTYIFISHDISVVRFLANQVMVLYLGRSCEYGPAEIVLNNPAHPYTKALIASVPELGKEHFSFKPIEGELPSPLNPPKGCAFQTRCPLKQEACETLPLENKITEHHSHWCSQI